MSTQPHRGSPTLHADATSFYLGLVLLLVGFALSVWRWRRGECRRFVRLPHLALR